MNSKITKDSKIQMDFKIEKNSKLQNDSRILKTEEDPDIQNLLDENFDELSQWVAESQNQEGSIVEETIVNQSSIFNTIDPEKAEIAEIYAKINPLCKEIFENVQKEDEFAIPFKKENGCHSSEQMDLRK